MHDVTMLRGTGCLSVKKISTKKVNIGHYNVVKLMKFLLKNHISSIRPVTTRVPNTCLLMFNCCVLSPSYRMIHLMPKEHKGFRYSFYGIAYFILNSKRRVAKRTSYCLLIAPSLVITRRPSI